MFPHEEPILVVERRIPTLKERCWCIHNTLPFKRLLGMLIVQMVSTCNFWLNIYPLEDGASQCITYRNQNRLQQAYLCWIWRICINTTWRTWWQFCGNPNHKCHCCQTGWQCTRKSLVLQCDLWQDAWSSEMDAPPIPSWPRSLIVLMCLPGQVGMKFTNMPNEEYDDDLGDDSGGEDDSDSNDAD